MNRIEEIEERMAAITAEIELPDTDLKVLTEEIKSLKEERKVIGENVEARKKLLKDIADGTTPAVVVKEFKEERKLENKTFEINSMEYREAYFKNLQGKPLDVEERAVISAASVIPTITLNKITEKLEQTSILYSRITVTNIASNLTLPRENAKADAAWVAVGTATTDDADSFDSVSLGAMKLIKTIEIGADVMAMSIDSFEAYIVNALTKKMLKAIENSILNGTGTTNPVGLLLAGQVTNVGTWTKAGMTYKDLMTIIADLPTAYHPNASFTTTREVFFGDMLGMVDANGQKIVVADAQAPSRFSILGYPVLLDDYCVADTVLFGDLSYYHFNWSKAIAIESDNSVGFRNGSTVYRGLALADGKPTLAEAFTKYTRAL